MHPIGHDRGEGGTGGDPTDREAGGVWMTKADLARVRRISVASADRLIRRQGWRKHPGKDGRARVLVPSDWATSRASGPTDAPRASPTDEQPARPAAVVATNPTDSATDPTDIARAVSTLESAVSTLREQLSVVTGRADQADADRQAAIALADQTVTLLKDAVSRADRAEQGSDAERARADALRDRVGAMQVQLDEAHAALQAATETERRVVLAEQGRDAERSRADGLADRAHVMQAQVDQLREQLATAQTEVETALRLAEARRKRTPLARILAAWRGE
jgi:hypothetical protein